MYRNALAAIDQLPCCLTSNGRASGRRRQRLRPEPRRSVRFAAPDGTARSVAAGSTHPSYPNDEASKGVSSFTLHCGRLSQAGPDSGYLPVRELWGDPSDLPEKYGYMTRRSSADLQPAGLPVDGSQTMKHCALMVSG